MLTETAGVMCLCCLEMTGGAPVYLVFLGLPYAVATVIPSAVLKAAVADQMWQG